MLLLVGTKLQGIITKMCLDSHDKSHVVRGTLLVQPSDHFFWLGWPKFLLHILHFILYQVLNPSLIRSLILIKFKTNLWLNLLHSFGGFCRIHFNWHSSHGLG